MRLLISTTILAFFATSCLDARPAKQSIGLIDGRWESSCLPIGNNGRHGMIVTLTISRHRISASSQVYAHATCDTPTVRVDYKGKFRARVAEADYVDIDHEVSYLTMTAAAPDVVTTYNSASAGAGCGLGATWKLNVPRAVAGRTCAPWTFPEMGTVLYDRAWRKADELRFGSMPPAWNNTSTDKRPTAANFIVFHRAT